MSGRDFMPEEASLGELRKAAESCQGCPLWRRATQTVFGEGAAHAGIMLVGEQPGEHEDRQGAPFVGPAGTLLEGMLAELGLGREDVYLTNAVKHFKWSPKGKRRIHQRPNAEEVQACLPWLREEIAQVRPRVLVCMGATAARALLGRSFKVSERRGELVRSTLAPFVMATLHPSSVLRAPDDVSRRRQRNVLVADLRAAVHYMGQEVRRY